MAEKFFPGFELKTFEPPTQIMTIPYMRNNSVISPPEITIVDRITIPMPDFGIIEPKPLGWCQPEVLTTFTTNLKQIDRISGSPRLTMNRRTIKFVTPEEMRPKTDAERQALIQRYGHYILDGGGGDCATHPNGTFTLRIGYSGQENTTSQDDILATIAHEYGHTIGKSVNDPTFEELKAYAFSNLLMRYYFNVTEYLVFQADSSTVHSTARFWLEQLLNSGIKEEQILAHLTQNRFKQSAPNDYLKQL